MRKILVIVVVLVVIGGVFAQDLLIQEVVEEEVISFEETQLVVPEFREVEVDFDHNWNEQANLAFSGGAVIDIDGDGVDEIFITGGMGQEDGLFRFDGENFVAIVDSGVSNDAASYGALSLDMDNDGDSDLVVARENGIYLHENDGEGRFTENKLTVDFAENTVPLTLTAADINQDGLLDLYVSTFVNAKEFMSATFNKPGHGKPNIMLLNDGEGGFEDITEQSGLAVGQNTFLSSFVDLNSDGRLDLVVAENTGQVRIFENLGDVSFEEVAVETGYGFWMGLAISDIDRDGDLDIYSTNVGNTIAPSITKGDLRDDQPQNNEWILLENKGDFVFEDSTEKFGLAGYEFAWGALFEDFNLDGWDDLIVLQNYIKWAPHKLKKAPGRFFINDMTGNFLPTTEQSGLVNEYYGMSPLVSDFNGDGYPDLVLVNLEGPVRAFINQGGTHHFVVARVGENAQSIGAIVELEKVDGSKIIKPVVAGMGLLSDAGANIYFGLGNDQAATSLKVIWNDGEELVINDPNIDTVIDLKAE